MAPPKGSPRKTVVDVPEPFRTFVEQNFYGRVSTQAALESVISNAEFLRDPVKHVALFSDHGVVHARDVVAQVGQVIDAIHGVLIPARPPGRRDFLHGYGTLLGYLHDIGMRDFSAYGRAMHPEFAAQAVFSADFDPLLDLVYEENSGNVAWRLLNLAARGLLRVKPQLALRELLSLSIGHNKSKVPIEVLNDPAKLRQTIRRTVSAAMPPLYRHQQAAAAERKLAAARAAGAANVPALEQAAAAAREAAATSKLPADGVVDVPDVARWYEDFDRDAYAWLASPDDPLVRELVEDVTDTLRCLRCADALRQRGTTLKTSAGYEMFVSQATANAVYAVRSADVSKLYMIEADDPLSAGEANMASSELTPAGDLRVAFNRGSFTTDAAVRRAARNAAIVINDIQADVIASFRRPPADPAGSAAPPKTDRDMQILVEHTIDNTDFAPLVCQFLRELVPDLGSRSRPVSALKHMAAGERQRYLDAEPFDPASPLRTEVLDRLAASGLRVAGAAGNDAAFTDVRVLRLRSGEVLIEAGTPAGFIYIPLGEGLQILPLGGYRPVSSPAWVTVGLTSIIRGAERNATVVAARDLSLIAMPKETYLQHWHLTYTPEEFTSLFGQLAVAPSTVAAV